MGGKAYKAPAVKPRGPGNATSLARAFTTSFSVLTTTGEEGIDMDLSMETFKEQRPLEGKRLRVKKMEDAINISIRVRPKEVK